MQDYWLLGIQTQNWELFSSFIFNASEHLKDQRLQNILRTFL